MQFLDLLWRNAQPGEDRDAWTIRQVLGERVLPDRRLQVLSAVICPIDDLDAQDLPHNAAAYLNRWNAARSDLLCEHVLTLPDGPQLPPPRYVNNRPTEDVFAWLVWHVAGLDVVADRPEGHAILRSMREIRIPPVPMLDVFHRSRYLLFRFFWDAYFHEL